ncbi:hypothetical protein JHD50_02985 [Sulfurimonas sp. MAG313]|nr:hypothetical protein [Sulfurimonas sp. MAG313]MDF1880277.1 hypothetical protein [Sulfurimonas sp. MAG313]
MTQNENFIQSKTKFVLASVAFIFCLVWAFIGEADIKLVAVSIAFMCFLYHGINMEMCAREMGSSH